MSPYWLGFMVGAMCAVVGALVEYLLARRRDPDADRLPGCMMLTAGALGLVGVASLILGLVLNQLGRSLWMGAGVGSGFVVGFLLMVGLWFLFLRR